jgi:hypothetical protein
MREYKITEIINDNVEIKLNSTKLEKLTKKEMEKVFSLLVKNNVLNKDGRYKIDFKYDIKITELGE